MTTPAAPFIKDPSAVKDYTVNFRTLGALETGENLVSASWQIEAVDVEDTALVEGEDDHAPTVGDDSATVWLVGGTAGVLYRVTCHEPTTDHDPFRVLDDVTFYVFVRET